MQQTEGCLQLRQTPHACCWPASAEQALEELLAHAHQLAARAAAGDAEAAANLTGEAGRRNDVDLLPLLTVRPRVEVHGGTFSMPCIRACMHACMQAQHAHAAFWFARFCSLPHQCRPGHLLLQAIALSEGGRQGALAAFEATSWGCSTRFGCRNSFER